MVNTFKQADMGKRSTARLVLGITVLPLIITLVIMLNYERATMQSEPLALQDDAEPTGTAAPAVTIPVTASGKWVVATVTTASEGLVSVTLVLYPEENIDLFPDHALRPHLFVHCYQQQLDASLVGSLLPADSEAHTVLVKFDALPAESVEMQDAGDGETLAFVNPAEIVEAMTGHEMLVITYSTTNSDIVEATFDLRGLSDVVDQLWNACPDTTLQRSTGTPNAVVSDPRDTSINDEDGVELGDVVMAEALDRNGCPSTTAATFDVNTDRIYVVAEDSHVVAGTEVFVRWYLDGEVYEDSPVIVADQDYENDCISFTLQLDHADQFRPGDYEAEFIINGNPAESVSFEIR
jgi:hypothetical protein